MGQKIDLQVVFISKSYPFMPSRITEGGINESLGKSNMKISVFKRI